VKFKYTAFDSAARRMQGVIEANGEREAVLLLHEQGLKPIAIDRSAGPQARRGAQAGAETLLRQLGIMLRSGVALPDAFAAMRQSGIGGALEPIEATVRAGRPLSHAIRDARLSLPRYVPALIAAGEARGAVGDALVDAADLLQRIRQFRSEVLTRMLYPAILFASGLAAMLLLFYFVVPKFINLLASPRADLPWISIVVLRTGQFLGAHGPELLALLIALAVAMWGWLRTEQGRQQALEALARVPLVAPLLMQVDVARWLRVLADLSRGHLRLVDSLDIAEAAPSLELIRGSLGRVLQRVRSGTALSSSIEETGLFSPSQVSMVRAAERAGALAPTLTRLADDAEHDVRMRLQRLITLLEPVCILLIGGAIGVLMIGIMLAVSSLSNTTL
jgi:general secretion pathway protein F